MSPQLGMVKVKETVLSFLLVFVTALLILGLAFHSLTYLGYDLRDHSLTLWWALQLSSAFAFIPGFISAISVDSTKPPEVQQYNVLETKLLWCFGVFMLYGIFNFCFTDMVLNHGATPEIIDGQYALTSHGFGTVITREEFIKHRIYEARANSGHWMIFYALCLQAVYQKLLRGTGDGQG